MVQCLIDALKRVMGHFGCEGAVSLSLEKVKNKKMNTSSVLATGSDGLQPNSDGLHLSL